MRHSSIACRLDRIRRVSNQYRLFILSARLCVRGASAVNVVRISTQSRRGPPRAAEKTTTNGLRVFRSAPLLTSACFQGVCLLNRSDKRRRFLSNPKTDASSDPIQRVLEKKEFVSRCSHTTSPRDESTQAFCWPRQ